jgi:multiple antibiotic resistance protein
MYGSVALLALTNPLAEMPFFLTATDGLTPYQRRIAAVKGAIGVAIVLGVSAVSGTRILIILAGLEMLRGNGSGLTSVSTGPGDEEDHLWVPLVMPLLAGPAAITATITLALEETTAVLPVGTLAAVFVSAAAVLVMLLATATLTSSLSRRVIRIFERFSGMILVAIGFQMGLSGIQQFIRTH